MNDKKLRFSINGNGIVSSENYDSNYFDNRASTTKLLLFAILAELRELNAKLPPPSPEQR